MSNDLMKFGVVPIRSVNRKRYIHANELQLQHICMLACSFGSAQRVDRSGNAIAESELISSYFNERFVLGYDLPSNIGPILTLCSYIAAVTWKNSACQLDVQNQ
jgi:hypothetical protein